MPIESCRGRTKKEEIVKNYNIKPVAHLTLLSGQNKVGCCGKLTTTYYVFEATNIYDNEVETFYVGEHCASEFLLLINHDTLPVFNPLHSIKNIETNYSNKTNNINDKNKIDPLNKELYIAIHLLCTAWNKPPKYVFFKALNYIRKNPGNRTQNWPITKFNDALSYDSKKRSLTKILEELRGSNPNLKNFVFPEMKKVLEEENVKSYL